MNDTQLQLVTYEQAKRLKAAGFDWPVEFMYADGRLERPQSRGYNVGNWNYDCPTCERYSAPTVALALMWMRDVHNKHGDISRSAVTWNGISRFYYTYSWVMNKRTPICTMERIGKTLKENGKL